MLYINFTEKFILSLCLFFRVTKKAGYYTKYSKCWVLWALLSRNHSQTGKQGLTSIYVMVLKVRVLSECNRRYILKACWLELQHALTSYSMPNYSISIRSLETCSKGSLLSKPSRKIIPWSAIVHFWPDVFVNFLLFECGNRSPMSIWETGQMFKLVRLKDCH